MGAIGGFFGLSGGAGGTGFAGPAQANIQTPITNNQIGEAYSSNISALQQQQNLLNALQGQNGLQNQSSVFNQLQGVANGTGPNPAQAMLNQATGANVANQAALMAGQRGASNNVGLMARQAAQQGGALQQQAVGQGATMQANQSLNALGQLGGLANQQVANQIGATGAITSAQQSEQGNLLNALAAQNNAQVGSQSSVNSANAGLAGGVMGGQRDIIGGIMNAAGMGSKMATGKAYGGMLAEGGAVSGPQSSFGQFLINPPMANGGEVDVVLSPGEKVVAPENVEQAAKGNVIAKTVPGKPKVAGDSLKNDTFQTKLPEGSIVVKRTKAKNDKDSASFVRNVLAKRGRK